MGELFQTLCSISTLDKAWRRVRRTSGVGGLDGVMPGELERDINNVLLRLSRDLLAKRYVPVPYAGRSIPKLNAKNEWRRLAVPSVIDKVVQQAFIDVVGNTFEREFTDCSYAYRKGKGPVKAVKRVEHILRCCKIRWVATLDIDNFFDTMDHQILLDTISRRLEDTEMLTLVRLWLKSGVIGSKGKFSDPREGVAQGSVVSPLFSNIYLHCLDRFAVESGYHYVRYSDNFILLSDTKEDIYCDYMGVKGFLEDTLMLKLNDNPYPFKDTEKGFTFLGIFFRGDKRRISKAKEAKVFRKLDMLMSKCRSRSPRTLLKWLNDSVEGTKQYYSFINPDEQFGLFDRYIIKRLKILAGGFLKRGVITSNAELRSFLARVNLFVGVSPDRHDAFCRDIAKEIYKDVKGGRDRKGKKAALEDGSMSRRQTAQKNRYLKRVAEETEVVVSKPGIFIGKRGQRIVLREMRKHVMDLPFSKVKNIAVSSHGVSMSSDLVFHCSHSDIPITFYTYRGIPYAMLQTPMHSMGIVSVLQIKTYETEKALELVKKILTGKSRNQMNLLKFYLRSRKSPDSAFGGLVRENLGKMREIIASIQGIKLEGAFSVTRDRLFSAEGRISSYYWACMKLNVPVILGFEKRKRLHATDVVNSMLNYGYGILYQRVWRSILKAGLNPHISFLHAFQPNKPTLVYDLVEEYRQPFIDRPIFSFMTRGRRGRDLKVDVKTGMLTKETRDKVVKVVIKRLSGLITFRGRKVKCEEVIDTQTRNLVSFLHGKTPYRPFIAGY